MREEIKNNWEQAKADLRTAENSLKSGDYYASVFWCQQSLEKALKSYILLYNKENPFIHSLIKLGRIAGIPKRYEETLKNISPEYYATRYADASGEIPYKLYSKKESLKLLNNTKEVIEWISTQMKE
ncbi:MAG: HEPN domain-containing protein [Candidatus Pacearchaeota archaeon]